MKITILIILLLSEIHGLDVESIDENSIIGKLGVPILHNVIVDGVVKSNENTKAGGFSLIVGSINGKKPTKDILIALRADWPGYTRKFIDGERVCILVHETIDIGNNFKSIPDSEGLGEIKAKYEIPTIKKIEATSNWFKFEVRSTLIYVADVKLRS